MAVRPQDQIPPLRHRFPPGRSRGAVVDDAAVVRPSKPPAMSEQIFGLALVGAIAAFFWINSAVNPRATSSRPIVLQILHVRELLMVSVRPTVDFFQHGFHVGFANLSFDGILPSERIDACISGARILFCFLLYSPAQVINE